MCEGDNLEPTPEFEPDGPELDGGNLPDIPNITPTTSYYDSAEFSAGFLYGWSDQLIDKRGEISGCYQQSAAADQALIDGFTLYELRTDADNDTGHQFLNDFLAETYSAMSACD